MNDDKKKYLRVRGGNSGRVVTGRSVIGFGSTRLHNRVKNQDPDPTRSYTGRPDLTRLTCLTKCDPLEPPYRMKLCELFLPLAFQLLPAGFISTPTVILLAKKPNVKNSNAIT